MTPSYIANLSKILLLNVLTIIVFIFILMKNIKLFNLKNITKIFND